MMQNICHAMPRCSEPQAVMAQDGLSKCACTAEDSEEQLPCLLILEQKLVDAKETCYCIFLFKKLTQGFELLLYDDMVAPWFGSLLFLKYAC